MSLLTKEPMTAYFLISTAMWLFIASQDAVADPASKIEIREGSITTQMDTRISKESGYNTSMDTSTVTSLVLDQKRREVSALLDPKERSKLGQFMTPSSVATFMSSRFKKWPNSVRLLDPGAGMGSLTTAFVEQFLANAPKNASIMATAYEIDKTLLDVLQATLHSVSTQARAKDFAISSKIVPTDFIVDATFLLSLGSTQRYTHALLNPPYKKINSDSLHRKLLSDAGIETVNLYAAFLALAVALTEDGGEIVAIIPRSFCNGTYFRPFRTWLLERVAIRQIHVFESRKRAFHDDDVLQENVIVVLDKMQPQKEVSISSSNGPSFDDYVERKVAFKNIVNPSDANQFIHIPVHEKNGLPHLFQNSLEDIGVDLSTGPVVDFRVRDHWQHVPKPGSVPLLYAHHFVDGRIAWPRDHKKPNAIELNDDTVKWLLPRGYYCVTRRFSAKEEKRRIVAFVVDPDRLPSDFVGIENHLNVFHFKKAGVRAELAYGLATFLNSTNVDEAFRLFSGHTQVNASDLRALKYPSTETLISLGKWATRNRNATQSEIDIAVAAYGG